MHYGLIYRFCKYEKTNLAGSVALVLGSHNLKQESSTLYTDWLNHSIDFFMITIIYII